GASTTLLPHHNEVGPVIRRITGPTSFSAPSPGGAADLTGGDGQSAVTKRWRATSSGRSTNDERPGPCGDRAVRTSRGDVGSISGRAGRERTRRPSRRGRRR